MKLHPYKSRAKISTHKNRPRHFKPNTLSVCCFWVEEVSTQHNSDEDPLQSHWNPREWGWLIVTTGANQEHSCHIFFPISFTYSMPNIQYNIIINQVCCRRNPIRNLWMPAKSDTISTLQKLPLRSLSKYFIRHLHCCSPLVCTKNGKERKKTN